MAAVANGQLVGQDPKAIEYLVSLARQLEVRARAPPRAGGGALQNRCVCSRRSGVRCAFPWARQVAAQELRALEVQQEHMLAQYHTMGKLVPGAPAKDAGGDGRRKADGGKARQGAGEFGTPAGSSGARARMGTRAREAAALRNRPDARGVLANADYAALVPGRQHLLELYRAVLLAACAHADSFVSGPYSTRCLASDNPRWTSSDAAFNSPLRLRRATDKLEAWRHRQSLGQLTDEEEMQQLDIFQLECEYLAIVLGSLRAQLTQLQAVQARLVHKADDPGRLIGPLARPRLLRQSS